MKSETELMMDYISSIVFELTGSHPVMFETTKGQYNLYYKNNKVAVYGMLNTRNMQFATIAKNNAEWDIIDMSDDHNLRNKIKIRIDFINATYR